MSQAGTLFGVSWIKSFLSQRTQQVVVNGKSSSLAQVKSGVPQGTAVLRPLLFLVYFNDLLLCIGSKVHLFAGDAYLYRSISSINDTVILQIDLNNVPIWEQLWSMEFHPNKCKLLRITNKRKLIITNYNENLESVDTAKYLGVIINKRLKWNTHINMVCKKGTQTQNFLQRNLKGCSRATKEKAYKT